MARDWGGENKDRILSIVDENSLGEEGEDSLASLLPLVAMWQTDGVAPGLPSVCEVTFGAENSHGLRNMGRAKFPINPTRSLTA